MKKEASPGEGTNPRAEQFTYMPTPLGLAKVWTAYAARAPYWCIAHEHSKAQPGTKVCVVWYTDGALLCPRCRPGVLPTRIGYVPVWREVDHKPCLVIVHESVEELLKGVGFGVRVMIGCMERGSSVFVKPTEDQPRWKSEHPLRQRACDLSLSLYTLWGYTQLVQWDAMQARDQKHQANNKDKSEPTTSSGAKFGPMTRNAAVKAEQLAGDSVDDVVKRVNERAAQHEPSTNGKPPPKG